MHLSRLILFTFCTALGGSLVAQNKPFTMNDAVLGLRGGAFTPENLKQLQWKNKTLHYTQIVGDNKASVLIQNSVSNATTDTLIDVKKLNAAIFGKDSLTSIPVYTWNASDFLIVSYKQTQYTLEPIAKGHWKLISTISLANDAANTTWDHKKKQIAYTIGTDLYLLDAYNKNNLVAKSTAEHIVIGQSVHRNEFGISNGIFFSPNDNYVAYYKMDESMVTDYPIIDWSKTPAVNNNIKYPMAGKTSHQVTIGVYNIITKQTVALNITGPKDQYLTNISWSPDEQWIFVGVLNRAQNHLQFNQYSAKTGQFIKTIFEEKSNKYVEPQHPLYFLNNNEFVWMSQRDGYMHLYRYNISGKLLNQVTKGNWLVNSINGKHDASNTLLISATKEDAREKHNYAVNWVTGSIERLDNQQGIHNAVVHSSGNYLINYFQNPQNPRTIELIDLKKGVVKNLLTSKDQLKEYATAIVENVVLKADDGTNLYGKLIKPRDFDPKKKYPVIVYLYNGPHLQLITNGYPASGNLWYDYMCQNGYIVFTMDGRGSSNRGFQFESAVHRQLGQIEMKDQLVGVDYLKALPFVDADRMGVHGWSFGGFMTTSLMTQYPNVFKVGVAGGPVIDWSLYEIMYTERYMGTPENNKTGFDNNELSSKVDKVNGKLLLIHGADDDVVVLQHAMKFLDASVKKSKQVDFYVYPGHKHNVLGKDRVHLMQKITDYFDLYLKK